MKVKALGKIFVWGTVKSNIIALQEIWQNRENITQNFEILNIKERSSKRGGGTATIIDNYPMHTIQKKFNINQDSDLIRINPKINYIWILNIYLNQSKISKIQKLFGKIQKNVPLNELSQMIVAGDFNVNGANNHDDNFIFLSKLCKQLGLRIELPPNPTRSTATLDFLICGKNVKIVNRRNVLSPSDHQAVRWELEIEFPKKPKTLKIPSKKTAEKITEKLLRNKEVTCSAIFLDELVRYRHDNRKNLKKIVSHKPRDTQLFEKLLALDDPSHTNDVINDHWKKKWIDTEHVRFSNDSKIAYKDLKTMLKYHLYEKRDGGIISNLQAEDGTIISEPDKVTKQLAKTIEEIQVDKDWAFIRKDSFPRLPIMKEDDLIGLLQNFATNKAISLDGLSGILFNKENVARTAKILKDLWSIDLSSIKGIEASFTSRLVSLNKVFPQIPTRKQMRPILVCSPLQKILEARFLPKLTSYLSEKMVTGQTGFVAGMGIDVNLCRAVWRIKTRTDKYGVPVFGLFVDFANAFNTVPHTALFQKLRLKKVLDEDEIQYLEALYANYRIRIGNKFIRYNKGVAQGSILSPALFNIFIEDLAEELAKELGMSMEDILMYADDLIAMLKH